MFLPNDLRESLISQDIHRSQARWACCKAGAWRGIRAMAIPHALKAVPGPSVREPFGQRPFLPRPFLLAS